MDIKTKIRSLVQQAVEAYIREQTIDQPKPAIAVLLGYQSPNPSEVLEAVARLQDNYDVTLILKKEWVPLATTSAYLVLEESNYQELQEVVAKSSLLVFPVASYQLLSKLALSMDDDLTVWVAIQHQLLGKPIVIANDHIEPSVYQQIHAPHSVLERLGSYIRQIQLDQVKWVSLTKLITTIDEQINTYYEKRPLILAKHIEKAHQDGLKEIDVSMKSKITPSAKDLAKDLSIEIKKYSQEGG
ncbi:MAG TPA: hypothetical protein VJ546_10890 [Bacillales bacterium]|nr:hypothetical protein [Bacillales bacterium]